MVAGGGAKPAKGRRAEPPETVRKRIRSPRRGRQNRLRRSFCRPLRGLFGVLAMYRGFARCARFTPGYHRSPHPRLQNTTDSAFFLSRRTRSLYLTVSISRKESNPEYVRELAQAHRFVCPKDRNTIAFNAPKSLTRDVKRSNRKGSVMAKQDEIEFPIRIGDILTRAADKPFSEPSSCGRHLIRIGTIMTLLPPLPARILDLGCGTGWTSMFFAHAGYEVVGVDIAPEMIRVANEQRDAAELANLSFVVSDYEALAFRDEFDAVVFFDSLHHADDEALAVRRAFAALKPGGIFLAEEPGVGHATSAESLAAVATYGTTEKDMPPAHIVALGREAGFGAFRVFPHPDELGVQVYESRSEPIHDPFAEVDEEEDTVPTPPAHGPRILRLAQRSLRQAADITTAAASRVAADQHRSSLAAHSHKRTGSHAQEPCGSETGGSIAWCLVFGVW